ncbi:DNA polymerase beta-like protein [Macrophomina phaseolina]|uniref:DNA polymerase n=1 Tax=Macrophomina phaseolina TaxID=35725 RepID=A0ABQ8GGQ4_9PEZI|nr:DNA polymerase beta-like protein [Macrophomina phaseolina]
MASPTLAELAQLPRAPGKKKKATKIKLVPEYNRIFKDRVFFFFPNNDTNGARRMRITKALEYGATWVVEWCDDVTHVVLDKSVSFGHLKKYLKVDALPEDVVVVNEIYPADCIMYKALIDHKQPHYQVPGYEVAFPKAQDKDHQPSAIGLAERLQLKPSGKGTAAAQLATAPRPGESNSELMQQHLPLKNPQASPEPKQQPCHQPSGVYNDALEEIISGTKNTGYIPLDIEDEDLSLQTSDIDDTDTEDARPKKIAKTSFNRDVGTPDQFQCMNKNDGMTKDTNPNARTIEILTEMGNYYEQTKDEWRSRAYRKAVSTLQKQERRIITKDQALQLPFVGDRLAAKIEEIVWTNRLRRLENARMEPGDEALQNFLKIYGVGLSKARKWVMAGLRTLQDLEEYKIPLTPAQQVGMAHYEDFNTRIPREEVSKHADVVRDALQAIDPKFTATVSGSYRRGAQTSGDIDILISRPGVDLARLQVVVFDELVPKLTATGFLKVALASHTGGDSGSGTKWHGASALPVLDGQGKEVWRRIDLLLVPDSQLGAALIYFTGNDIFNRSIRLLASRKGMRLNQRGLFRDVMRDRRREKVTDGELVEGRDERRIFEILGVPWRPPEHRIC